MNVVSKIIDKIYAQLFPPEGKGLLWIDTTNERVPILKVFLRNKWVAVGESAATIEKAEKIISEAEKAIQNVKDTSDEANKVLGDVVNLEQRVDEKLEEVRSIQWYGTRAEYDILVRTGQINDDTIYFVYDSDSPEGNYSLSEDGTTLTLSGTTLSEDGTTLTIPVTLAVLSEDGSTLIFN